MKQSSGPFAAALIDATRRAWAASAAVRLRERGVELGPSFAVAGSRDVSTHFDGLLEHLSVALHFDAPPLFLEHLRWTSAAYLGRGIPSEALRASVECLREELEARLPVHASSALVPLWQEAMHVVQAKPVSAPSELLGDSPLVELAREYLLAALEGRRLDALHLVLDAAQRGVEIAALQRDVIGRAQVEVGRMWHQGDLSVVEEHLVSRLSEQVLASLNLNMPRAPRNGRRVLVTGANGDLHDIGLRVIADRFEMAGWDPIYLGASTPFDEAARGALDFKVDLVALGAKLAVHVRPAAAMIAALRAEPRTRSLPVIVGGQPFQLVPDLWSRIGASAAAASADEALELAARLVGLGR